MAELKGAAVGTVGIRDLALAAAFTSTSLRDRWSEPDEEDPRELMTLAEREREKITVCVNKNTFLLPYIKSL